MSKNVWLKRKRKREIKEIVQEAINKHKTKDAGKNDLNLDLSRYQDYIGYVATYICTLIGVTHRYPAVGQDMWVGDRWISIPKSFKVEANNGS